MARKTTMARVRKGKRKSRGSGFVVTWDVDSKDRPTAARVYRFVYGDSVHPNGKVYRYQGFVEREGSDTWDNRSFSSARAYWRRSTGFSPLAASIMK